MANHLPRMIISALALAGLLVPATARARSPLAAVRMPAAAATLPSCLRPTTKQAVPELRTVEGITVAGRDDLWVHGEPAAPGRPSILHSDGNTWRAATQGLPPGARLTSIAAAGSDAIWGVGSMQAGNPLAHLLVVRWQGVRWQQVAVPVPITGTHNGPAAIAAARDYANLAVVAGDDVWLAAGQGFGQPVVLHWDGRQWAAVPGAGTFGNVSVASIAASGPADVWLVGEHDGGSVATLHYDGHGWSDEPPGIPAPSDPAVVRPDGSAVGLESRLLTVDALSPGEVWAVGTTMYSSPADLVDRRGLALRWNGARWSEVPVPYPGIYSDLHAVAIAAPRDIWAVGGPGLGLLHWDGARWTGVPTAWGTPSAVAIRSSDRVLVGGTRTGIGTAPGQGVVAEYGPIRCAPADPVLARIALPAGSTAAALDITRQHLFALGTAATMIDAASGHVLATTPLSGRAIAATAVPGTGRVFVLSTVCPTGTSYACAAGLTSLDAATGAAMGTIPLPDQPVALALDPRNLLLYALTARTTPSTPAGSDVGGPGTLSAIDAATGKLIFARVVGLNPVALAADGATGHVAVIVGGPGGWNTDYGAQFYPLGVGSGPATVVTVDGHTGVPLHTALLPVGAGGLPIIAASSARIYVWVVDPQRGGYQLITLDPASGALIAAQAVASLDRPGLDPQARIARPQHGVRRARQATDRGGAGPLRPLRPAVRRRPCLAARRRERRTSGQRSGGRGAGWHVLGRATRTRPDCHSGRCSRRHGTPRLQRAPREHCHRYPGSA